MPYKFAKTQDEEGRDRFFIEDERGDWPYGPYDSQEEACEEMANLEIDAEAKRRGLR
jgi:hypothetical protein